MSFVSPALRQSIRQCLTVYQSNVRPLPGIQSSPKFETFLLQAFDSIRRIEYVFELQKRDIDPIRKDPNSGFFDPLKASILYSQAGNFDEACWLAFLSTHFGKNLRTGWQLLQQVYGSLAKGPVWDWNRLKVDPQQFTDWLSTNGSDLEGCFGNHRKYQTLKVSSRAGTSAAFTSYVEWVGPSHSHLLHTFKAQVGEDSGLLFDSLYKSMRKVQSFGRMARFDYLCLLGKLKLFPIEPASAYIKESTGPLCGANLLMTGSKSQKLAPDSLEQEVQRLGDHLSKIGVRFSMQVLEDALCNWQKSPTEYKRFRG